MFKSVSVEPNKIKVGETQTTLVEIDSKDEIEKVFAQIPFEGGYDEVALHLVAGDNKKGVWEGKWVAHNTLSKQYETKISVVTSAGEIKTTTATWWDDTETTWFDQNWTQRKQVVVTEKSAEALSNYQIKITVPYLSAMQPDFDDVRFTSADGKTLLDYWLEEKTDSTTATFWVEVASLPASANTSIYYYYGNTIAGTLSNGTNTFLKFDHFDDASIDVQWTAVNPDGNQTISESGTNIALGTDGAEASDLNISTSNQDAPRIIQSISGNFVIESKITTTNAYYDLTGILIWKDSQNFYGFGKGLISGSERIWRRKNIADALDDSNYGSTAYAPDTVYLKMVRSGSTLVSFYTDADNYGTWTQAFSETFNSSDPVSFGFVRFDNTTRTYTGLCDWIFVRKYVSSEPTISVSTQEEKRPTDAGASGVSGGGPLAF